MVLEIQTKIVQLETQECVLYERPVKVGNLLQTTNYLSDRNYTLHL